MFTDTWILMYEDHTRPVIMDYSDNQFIDIHENFYAVSEIYFRSPNSEFHFNNNLFSNFTGSKTTAEIELPSGFVFMANNTWKDIEWNA